jgi:hypothetical protein
MDYATLASALLATPFALTLLPLTVRLLPVIHQIGKLVSDFTAADPEPLSCYYFETQLQALLREVGRIIIEWVYNRLEPDDRLLMPNHLRFDGDWYRCRAKTANRNVATLFGTITLWRYLYQPIHGVERSIFPLEIRLGLVTGRATPALAERAAHAATDSTQETVRAQLKRDQGVAWSVATLRKVIAATQEGMTPHLHDAQVAQVLAWLEQAHQSRGGRKPVLAAGRDGVFVPIRGDDSYREAATATLSVLDRAGQRLGTVYLGQMPEPGQKRLSDQLTELISAVLMKWSGPLPRLAYITDAGHHPTEYYEQVLKPMRHPCRPAEKLEWEWVLDFYHVSTYIHKMADALFRDSRQAQAWARKMCRWLKSKPHAIYRILHSAAALRHRRMVLGAARKAYRQAYDYLRARIQHLDYVRYRKAHLPIGSGVTEAACKTVFSERLRRSRMTWSGEGGQRIVDLRVIWLSGIWPQVYHSYLQSQLLPEGGTQESSQKKKAGKAA